jgi:hypothetical protein
VPSSSSNTGAPVDPPIPVPDVAGADAAPRGLPRRDDLSIRQKLIVDSSAIADVGLRTMIASIVGAAMLPKVPTAVLRPADARAEREALRFYAELGAAQDPETSFPAPTELPRVSSRPANPFAEWTAHGPVQNIKFKSSFEAINPAMREHRRGYERNNVVHAQHWLHDDGCRGSTGRATTCCCTRCRSTASARKGSRPSAATATSRTVSPGSPRRWPRRCTTSVRCWTISSTPAWTGSR